MNHDMFLVGGLLVVHSLTIPRFDVSYVSFMDCHYPITFRKLSAGSLPRFAIGYSRLNKRELILS